FCACRIGQKAADAEQFGDTESAADLKPLHGFLNGCGVREGDASFADNSRVCRSSLLLVCVDLLKIGHGFQAVAELPAAERPGFRFKKRDDFVEFKFG